MCGIYWERSPNGTFATLIAVAAAHCSPDAYDGAYDDLISRARAPDPGNEDLCAFTAVSCPTPSGTTTAATRRSCAACCMTGPATRPAPVASLAQDQLTSPG